MLNQQQLNLSWVHLLNKVVHDVPESVPGPFRDCDGSAEGWLYLNNSNDDANPWKMWTAYFKQIF